MGFRVWGLGLAVQGHIIWLGGVGTGFDVQNVQRCGRNNCIAINIAVVVVVVIDDDQDAGAAVVVCV